jgi:hypothetical protein
MMCRGVGCCWWTRGIIGGYSSNLSQCKNNKTKGSHVTSQRSTTQQQPLFSLVKITSTINISFEETS